MDLSKEKVGMFEENAGETSHMRVQSFLSFLTSIGLAIPTLILGSEIGLWLVIVFLIAGFAPKAIQKFAENENLFKRLK